MICQQLGWWSVQGLHLKPWIVSPQHDCIAPPCGGIVLAAAWRKIKMEVSRHNGVLKMLVRRAGVAPEPVERLTGYMLATSYRGATNATVSCN